MDLDAVLRALEATVQFTKKMIPPTQEEQDEQQRLGRPTIQGKSVYVAAVFDKTGEVIARCEDAEEHLAKAKAIALAAGKRGVPLDQIDPGQALERRLQAIEARLNGLDAARKGSDTSSDGSEAKPPVKSKRGQETATAADS